MDASKKGLRPADLKEYVDIHGRNVRVEVSPTGEYLIPLSDLKQAGFTIYVKSQYNKLLVDESDFTEEFHNHMLGAATTWCLSNKHSFSDHEIVQSIQNARKILLAEHSKQAKAADPAKSGFLRERLVAEDVDSNIQITKTVTTNPPKPTTPSPTPHHATPPVRPLTSQNLERHNLTERQFSNGNRTPPTRDASDGEGKGSFHGRRSFEQNNQNHQRRSTDNHGQFNNQRSPGEAMGRSEENNGSFARRSGGGDNSGSFNQRNAEGNTGQYSQRRSGGGDNATSFGQRKSGDNNPSFGENPTLREPHQRFDNQNNQSMSKMPQKGAFNRPPRVEMDLGENEVVVTSIEATPNAEKQYSVIWVQKVSTLPLLAKITETINAQERTVSPVEPQLHKVYMAMHEGDWYRCRVCGLNPTKVFFLDYGNKAIVNEVKPMSEEMTRTPQQVIKVNLMDDSPPPKVDDVITVIVNKVMPSTNLHVAKRSNTTREDNGVNSMMSKMSLNNSSAQSNCQNLTSPPKQQRAPAMIPQRPAAFFGIPRPVVQLRTEMMVKLVEEQLGCFYLISKECADEQRTIANEISSVKLTPVDSVQPDQLVLCRDPTSGEVCRAVVLRLSGPTVKVQLLDHPKSFDLPLDSLMAITESLSKRPTTLLKSPQMVGYTKPYGDSTKAYLQKCIIGKTKLKTLIGQTGKFDLMIMQTEELLSQIIQNLEAPPSPPAQLNTGKVMLSDLRTVTLQFESNQLFLCSMFVSMDEITIIHQTEELIELIEVVIRNELDDNTPYTPIVNEVCLGFYEGSWYRCAVRARNGDSYSVFFIDFGNEVVLKSAELRKLTDDLLDIPVLGSKARITDFPRNPGMEKTLRLKITDDIAKMNVISFSDGKYNITIPDELIRAIEAEQ